MLKNFANVHLLTGWLPTTIFSVAGLGIAILLITQCLNKQWKLIGRELIITVIAATTGLLAAWLVSDVFMLFEVSLGWMVIFAIAGGFAALGFVISTLVMNHGWKRILAALMILAVLTATILRIDMIYGEYTTIGSLFSVPTYPRLDVHRVNKPVMTVEAWRQSAQEGTLPDYPQNGKSFTVNIDNTLSDFQARTADIYLPPAALSNHPPALPVFVLLAGQPGSPDRLFTAGNIESMMNTYAASHHGLSPIVVSPDQNGASDHNSLCVDSPVYGKAETYLTKDVPNWITHNLPVSKNPKMWAIGGFSQGGTCSTQLAPRHPNIYGNMMPANGEIGPTQGSKESMIAKYFQGNAQALKDQEPITAIEQHAPSTQTIFAGAGAKDPTSINNMTTIAQAGKQAGMEAVVVVAQGHGHDWHAVQAVWEPALNWLGERMGLGPMSKNLAMYKNISEVPLEG